MRRLVVLFAVIMSLGLIGNAGAEEGGFFQDFDWSFGVRVGYTGFSGGEAYWNTLEDNFRNDFSDFSSISYGFEMQVPITSFLDLTAGIDYFSTDVKIESDVLFDANGDGSQIISDYENDVKLTMIPIHVIGLRYHPFKAREWKFSPYIGLQASILYWKYEEEGLFVSLDSRDLDGDGRTGTSEVPDYLVIEDKTEFDDLDLAVNFQIGVEYYVARNFTIGFMARYTLAEDQLNRQFTILSVRDTQSPKIQDVFVTNLNNYDRFALDNFDVGLTLLYKF